MDIEDIGESERLEYERKLGEMEAEYKKLSKGLEIELCERLEALKPNWYLWSATRNDIDGSVQADYSGELIAHETFEAD